MMCSGTPVISAGSRVFGSAPLLKTSTCSYFLQPSPAGKKLVQSIFFNASPWVGICGWSAATPPDARRQSARTAEETRAGRMSTSIVKGRRLAAVSTLLAALLPDELRAGHLLPQDAGHLVPGADLPDGDRDLRAVAAAVDRVLAARVEAAADR